MAEAKTDDGQKPSEQSQRDLEMARGRWFAGTATMLAGLLTFGLLAYRSLPGSGETPTAYGQWLVYAELALALVIALGVAALVRFALAPLVVSDRATAQTDPEAVLRTRIAPLVLILGSVSIAILALSIIVAMSGFAVADKTMRANLDTVLTGIFSSVLPVFATWVGTVIAFYFTNESFRQATIAARGAAAVPQPLVSERMIPYEKIAKIEKTRADVRTVRMADVIAMLREPVTRVLIFDTTRQPVFIIRKRLIPEAWFTTPPSEVVDDYLKLNNGTNAADATQFGYVRQTATLEEARAAMAEAKSVDVFVTATGQKTEPVLGWLTDDILLSR